MSTPSEPPPPPPVRRWEVMYNLPPVLERTRSYQPVYRVIVPGNTEEDARCALEYLHPGSTVIECTPLLVVAPHGAAWETRSTPSGASPGQEEAPTPQAPQTGYRCLRCAVYVLTVDVRPDRTCDECRKELAWCEDMRQGR